MTDSADNMMLTIFLKHQQDKKAAEINAKSKGTDFWEASPPDGVEVVNCSS